MPYGSLQFFTPEENFNVFARSPIQIDRKLATSMGRDVKYLFPSWNAIRDSILSKTKVLQEDFSKNHARYISVAGWRICDGAKVYVSVEKYYNFFIYWTVRTWRLAATGGQRAWRIYSKLFFMVRQQDTETVVNIRKNILEALKKTVYN